MMRLFRRRAGGGDIEREWPALLFLPAMLLLAATGSLSCTNASST